MMKKTILLAAIILVSFFGASAQPVPNGSFENWFLNHYFDEPDFGFTSNLNAFLNTGNGNVSPTSDAHAGNYGAHFETVTNGTDTIPGVIIIGNPIPGGISGGIPFPHHPDSVYGYFKFNIQPNDTANIILIFKNNGNTIGSAFFQFTGSEPNYTRYATPVFWLPPGLLVPDTMGGFITSSSFNYAAIPGSEITMDEIHFTNAPGAPVGDFETWNAVESLEPEFWETLNFIYTGLPGVPVTQSSDAFDGNYAVQITTSETAYGDTLGYISNGSIGSEFFTGGTPITQNPVMVTGYYKYAPVGQDTAVAAALISYWDAVNGVRVHLDSALIKLEAAANYTPFTLPFNYNQWPVADTLLIVFGSSNWDTYTGINIGSTLLVDKLEVAYNPVAIESDFMKPGLSGHPNPATDYFVVQVGKGNVIFDLNVFDAFGRKVHCGFVPDASGQLKIETGELDAGTYFYALTCNSFSGKGKFTVVK